MPAVGVDRDQTRQQPSTRSWWERLLRNETRRSTVTALVAIVVTGPIVTVWLTQDATLRPHAPVVSCLVAWTLFAGFHALFAYLVCRRLSAAELVAAEQRSTEIESTVSMDSDSVLDRLGREARRGQRWWRRWSDRQNEAPSWSVQMSALALVVVAIILVTPALRISQGVLFATLTLVAASWVNVLVMYTIHYARLNERIGGLAFPGEAPEGLSDHLYLALTVQAGFGTADVQIRTRALRRVVAGHGALGFVFNSVIIAMIVSLLLGVAAG